MQGTFSVVRPSRGFKRSRCAPTLHVCNHTQTLSNVMITRRPSCAHSWWLHTCQIVKQGEKRPPSQPLLHTQVEGVRDQAACVRGENVTCPSDLPLRVVICAAGCSLVKAPPYLGGPPGLASSGGSFY